ncbi:mitochondrial inner membrane protease ATP23 homolog [Harpegnathos saltator]|uniref:Mitochondrial inner membrane protease ATP23 n=1 Tax=Harpegnathos saltator TaxID=610380 RepID=E2C4C5_HARSA|nr:mitochondrial inner membrane protease ATP23 homolog [Harpegnathos saltator]EFN77220.1 Mitochondrial inner membrane protease ATP23-like protein [Harpegnathos saltator]
MTVKNEKTEEKKQDDSSPGEKVSDKLPVDHVWGADMYPERKGTKLKQSWIKTMFGFAERESLDNVRCEANVYHCVKNSPIVKLMMAALKSSGCEIDIRRHISCEVCNTLVTGGYDSELNQVVICQNSAGSKGLVQAALLHEMIHMFDYCRNKLDLKNIDHLACTEIRAANIGHCSFMGSWFQGFSSPINIKATHQNCVKNKAKMSIMAVHKVKPEVAEAAIERVFTKCYNDLEPVGRRIRRNSEDMMRAYTEAYLYGYS